MTTLRILFLRIVAFLRRNSLEHDLEEEIRAHLAMRTDDNIRNGMTAVEARREALRRFGGIDQMKEVYRDHRGFPAVDATFQDFRHAIRSLRRYPIASAVAVISLAAGIGITTATMTVYNAVFRNPPPLYENPSQLSFVRLSTPQRPRPGAVPGGIYKDWSEEVRLYEGLAAAAPAVMKDLRKPDGLAQAPVQMITPELFSILGVSPLLGRTFLPEDGAGSGASATILSHGVWQSLFAGKADALGSVLWIDDRPHTVIGVMPERFWFSDMSHVIWTPLGLQNLRAGQLLEAVVRRRADTTPAALLQALQNRVDIYAGGLPLIDRSMRVLFIPVAGTPEGRAIAPGVVWLLETCVALTLLIACTNVAVLMIAQWTSREHEIAIRAALGANRARIVKALLTESTVLALLGGILGVCATFILRGVLLAGGPPDLRFLDLSIDIRILIRSAAITLLSGILVGVGPALYETRRLQINPLRRIPSDRIRQRWRHALVVFEITVTIALLVVTSALLGSYRRAVSPDLGFDITPLIAAHVEADDGLRVLDIRERLNSLPGVVNVAAATAIPMRSRGKQEIVASDAAGSNPTNAVRAIVSSQFFGTLGIPIRYGRGFAGQEDSGASPVVIVNELLAEQLWPGRIPSGMQLWIQGRAYEVVGVVGDYQWMPLTPKVASLYLPLSLQTETVNNMEFLIRAAGDPKSLLQPVRAELRSLRSGSNAEAFTLQSVADQIGWEILTTIYPMTPLIITGLLLTAAGIYGVVAFAITRRSRELAIRAAVGATRKDLLTLVAFLGLRLTAAGIALGIGTTFTLTRLVQARGGVFSSPNWPVFVVPVVLVLAITALATWIPSRRAVSIDPAVLMRAE